MNKLMTWWEEDLSGDKPVLTSSNFWDIVGYTKEELGNKRSEWITKLWPEEQEKMKDIIKNETWEIDFRLPQKDGSSIWLRETGRWQQVENGEPKKISVVVKNVTLERKSLERIESKEKESARIAREIMELCPVAMALFQVSEKSTKLLEINEAGIKLWKFTSYQNAAESFVQAVGESIPPFQPNGSKSIPLSERLAAVIKEGSIEFKTFLKIKDTDVNMKIHMKKIELPEKILVIVYMLPE